VAIRQIPKLLRSAGRNRSLAAPVRISWEFSQVTFVGRKLWFVRSLGALSDTEMIQAIGNRQ
jgi:hypothetical protein